MKKLFPRNSVLRFKNEHGWRKVVNRFHGLAFHRKDMLELLGKGKGDGIINHPISNATAEAFRLYEDKTGRFAQIIVGMIADAAEKEGWKIKEIEPVNGFIIGLEITRRNGSRRRLYFSVDELMLHGINIPYDTNTDFVKLIEE